MGERTDQLHILFAPIAIIAPNSKHAKQTPHHALDPSNPTPCGWAICVLGRLALRWRIYREGIKNSDVFVAGVVVGRLGRGMNLRQSIVASKRLTVAFGRFVMEPSSLRGLRGRLMIFIVVINVVGGKAIK